MIQAISRSEIFKRSVFVDNQIATQQQSIYRTINQDDPGELEYMMPFLDHLEALNPLDNNTNDFCVLAYAAENKIDYEANFASLLVQFFQKLTIGVLYIITECKLDWKAIPLENAEKQRLFLSMVKDQTDAVGYRLEVTNLPKFLPLFFFSHPDHPHIDLVPEQGFPISMTLCKDGNLHTLFDEEEKDKLMQAASSVGFHIGSYEICQVIATAILNEK